MLLSGNTFNSANSKSCSLQHLDQISQLCKRAGAVGGKYSWTIRITDTACLPPAPSALWQCGTAEPSLAFLHNMGQETGLSRVISQHSLAPFPGCFPGPLCYAVKALHAGDHGDKTYHDGSAAKGSRLCKNKQTGLPCSQQSAPSPRYRETKWVSRDGVPGISCLASDSVNW